MRPSAMALVLGLTVVALAGSCKSEKPEVPVVAVESVHPEEPRPAERPVESLGGTAREEPIPPPPAGPRHEEEPNEDREGATVLPINGGMKGSLSLSEEGAEDMDWFAIELPGPLSQQVRIQLSPLDQTDFVLEWMEPSRPEQVGKGDDPAGVRAVIDSTSKGEVEVLAPTALTPGTHYFRVRRARRKRGKRGKGAVPPEQPYRLTTTVVDPEGNLESEPNGTTDEAGVLRPGEPRSGYLGWFEDTDWYQLDLDGVPEGALIRVDLTGVPGVKTRLWMVDRRKRGLVKVPEPRLAWPLGSGVTVRDVGWEPRAGPLYVEVRTTRASNPHDPYTVTLSVEVPQSPHEAEPNWRVADALGLQPDVPVDGFLGHPTDWDVYRIDAEEPMIATVVVSGIAGVDVELEQLDRGKVVRTVNDAEAGLLETLALVPVGPGAPAFVRVKSNDQSYDVEKGYRIALSLVEAGDREIEPNDVWGDSARVVLPIGKPFEGFVHPRGDRDHFAIDVTADTPDESRILTLRLTGAEGLKLEMSLFDAQKEMITRKGGISGGQTRTITHGFTPGRYYVRVEEESGQAGNGASAYTIEVAE